MIKDKIIVTNIIVAIIFLGLGLYLGTIFFQTDLENNPEFQNLQREYNEVKIKWEAAQDYFGFDLNPEVKNLGGIVERVDGNTIYVNTGPSPLPFIFDWPEEREVVITENTEIVLRKMKSQEEIEKEWDDYMSQEGGSHRDFEEIIEGNSEEGGAVSRRLEGAPLEFEEIGVSINQIEERMQIDVVADRNIGSEKRFEAVQIFVTGQ